MTNHSDTTVRVPNGELGPVVGHQARSAYDGDRPCTNHPWSRTPLSAPLPARDDRS